MTNKYARSEIFYDKAKEVLALSWSLFNSELWRARSEMEEYLTKNFNLKMISPYDKAFESIIGQSWTKEEAEELIRLVRIGMVPESELQSESKI